MKPLMFQQMIVQQITALPVQIRDSEREAIDLGFRFVTRLIDDWESGENRFDAPGECFMAVHLDGQLLGFGGLSCDPYVQNGAGRLRRLYVAKSARRQSVGRMLVHELLTYASRHFRTVRLSTDTASGAAFYHRCGFEPLGDMHASHIKFLATF